MELAYLKSYQHMGQARVTCEGNCTCDEGTLNGNQQEHFSVTHLHRFYATQAAECLVVVEGAYRARVKEYVVGVGFVGQTKPVEHIRGLHVLARGLGVDDVVMTTVSRRLVSKEGGHDYGE